MRKPNRATFMGHANIRITLDQYGHLLPGAEDERPPACSMPSSPARLVGL